MVYVCVSETDISQRFDAGSPHLPWNHPFYDIARHQIIEVAGLFVSSPHPYLHRAVVEFVLFFYPLPIFL